MARNICEEPRTKIKGLEMDTCSVINTTLGSKAGKVIEEVSSIPGELYTCSSDTVAAALDTLSLATRIESCLSRGLSTMRVGHYTSQRLAVAISP